MRDITRGEWTELEKKPDKHKKCAVCYAKRVGCLLQPDIECQRRTLKKPVATLQCMPRAE
jgi:hypothetical protein